MQIFLHCLFGIAFFPTFELKISSIMKKLWFAFLLLPSLLFAQKSHFYVNTVWAGLGTSYTNLKTLNKSLVDARLTALNPNLVNVNVGFFHLNRHLCYGMDLTGLTRTFAVSGVGEPTFAYMREGMIMPKFGVVAYQFDEVYFIYPTIGVGGGGSFLRYRMPTDGTLYKNNVYGMVTEAALNATIVTPIPGDSDNNAVIGVSGGYVYTPKIGNSWIIEDARIGSNMASPQGFFFRVSFGMGTGNRD